MFCFLEFSLAGAQWVCFTDTEWGGSGDEAGEEGQECEEEEQSVDPAEADTGPETTEIGQVGSGWRFCFLPT